MFDCGGIDEAGDTSTSDCVQLRAVAEKRSAHRSDHWPSFFGPSNDTSCKVPLHAVKNKPIGCRISHAFPCHHRGSVVSAEHYCGGGDA